MIVDDDNMGDSGAPGSFWVRIAIAALFLFAQIVFASHFGATPQALADHAPDECAICIAGATAPDPVDLVAVLDAPVERLETIEYVTGAEHLTAGAVLVANSRAPPLA